MSKILSFVWWMINPMNWEWYQIRWAAYFILGFVLLSWIKWGILIGLGLIFLDYLYELLKDRWKKFQDLND